MTQPRDILAAPETGRLSFADLPGWDGDNLAAALAAYSLSETVDGEGDARRFFEARFFPGIPRPCHYTGYYEPELDGSLTRSDTFCVPVHSLPAGGCGLLRAEIDAVLGDHVLLWLRDEVDRFFLQVQGSGRICLPGGDRVRVGYAGKNGHVYHSIGKLLIERGVFDDDITADALKSWLRQDAARGRAVMNENPSYVFFQFLDIAADAGPTGTLGCPVSAGRTLAVDPDHIPLGTPVWIEVNGMARLCIAQDTGSAIKGPGRADLFFGTGDAAGQAAGRLNQAGRLVPLVAR